MSIEVHFRFDTAESHRFNRLVNECYDVHAPDLDDNRSRIRYEDAETCDLVLMNSWDSDKELDRWIALDPAAELFLLANVPPEATIVRTP